MKHRLRIGLLMAAVLLAVPGQASAATVVVDAGHGGSDPGAVGVNGLYEKNVNLDIAFKLRDELLQKGYDVVLTRDSDRKVSLAERVELANVAQADAFVSVHANSHPSANVNGSMVLYYDRDYPQPDYPASDAMAALTPESKKLAEYVLKNMVAATGFANKGLVPSAAYVIRMGRIPSILVETAFLSNAEDAAKLADEDVRKRLAAGIAQGIAEYLPLPAVFPDTAGHWAREAVLRLKEKGIIEGEGNRFYPERPVTRAEWLTVGDRLFRFADRAGTAPTGGTPVLPPRDLPASHWAYTTFQNALRLGFIDGYPDGSVKPDAPITRAEAAALLERMSGEANKGKWTGPIRFTDVPADHWASGPIYRLQQKGVLNGVQERRFAPEKTMTRAEMAAMIDRYVALPQSEQNR